MHILIIDDHPLYLEVLSAHVQKIFSSAIVYEAASIEEAFALMLYKQFDMICLDLSLPDQSGLPAFLLLREAVPEALIVVISGLDDAALAQTIIDHGANGYLSKSVTAHEISNALTLIAAGETYISPCVLMASSDVAYTEKAITKHAHELTELTPRQQEVLQLVSKGLSNKLIASQLACSEGTIKLHVSAILRTMNVKNRTEAVKAMFI